MAVLSTKGARVLGFAVMAVAVAGLVYVGNNDRRQAARKGTVAAAAPAEVSSQAKQPQRYSPTPAQWAALSFETVAPRVFRSGHATEGKLSINEDTSTPVYSPYPGRVTKLLAKPGDIVKAGQALFTIEAADMVQAQNEFLAAAAGLNKAKSRLNLTEILEKQNRSLYDSRAGSLRDFQQSQADVAQARSELTSAEAALEAARNRLSILGKTEDEIATFQAKGRISPETPISAPLGGTVVQRKVGPGQYVSYTSIGSVDPVFTIGDLSTIWLVAWVRESDAARVRIGQQVDFTTLSQADQVFKANITYVAAAIDPVSRRLLVRATIPNTDGLFKPEMFANVTIFTEEGDHTLAVSRDAVIFEADTARVWVAGEDGTIERRAIRTGLLHGRMVQILQGLKAGERVVTRGSLFVDKAAGS